VTVPRWTSAGGSKLRRRGASAPRRATLLVVGWCSDRRLCRCPTGPPRVAWASFGAAGRVSGWARAPNQPNPIRRSGEIVGSGVPVFGMPVLRAPYRHIQATQISHSELRPVWQGRSFWRAVNAVRNPSGCGRRGSNGILSHRMPLDPEMAVQFPFASVPLLALEELNDRRDPTPSPAPVEDAICGGALPFPVAGADEKS